MIWNIVTRFVARLIVAVKRLIFIVMMWALVLTCIALGGGGFLHLVTRAVGWLKTGVWQSKSVAQAFIDGGLNLDWVYHPTDMIGAAEIVRGVLSVPLWVGLFVMAFVVGIIFVVVQSVAEEWEWYNTDDDESRWLNPPGKGTANQPNPFIDTANQPDDDDEKQKQ